MTNYYKKRDLEDKLLERVKGLMFRSKVKWYEEGETNSKYFYALEKARYNAKTCYKIIDDQEQELTETSQILQFQRTFYQQLYSLDQHVKFTMVNESLVRVPEEVQQEQGKQITLLDLEKAVKLMNNNKTPGSDGLPVDFYKVFWTQIKHVFYDMVEKVYDMEMLHESARNGILNLIPKANKDTRYIQNLRPITLLNTDYKIIEKAIANKMLPALEYIIHKDQRGFMKDRRISVNIRKILDIMHHAEKEDMEAVIMSLDFVKCFDKCSFSILHGSLEYFQFGDVIRKWTRILYKGFSVRIQNNGHFSSSLEVQKGVHQGGCCSSIYFLVIAEILAISLRTNTEIEGYTIKNIKQLLNQFADDMDIASKGDEKSLREIFRELDKFHYQSGFTVSYDKTTLYRIGSLRHSDAMMYDMTEYTWSNRDINILGVTITHEDIIEKNYGIIVEKAKATLNNWQNRDLSLLGKVQVINTLISSLFVYKMMVLPLLPQNIIKNMDNVVRNFLWNGKKSKIAYRVLQNSKNQGGLNLMDLKRKDISLKATWPEILHQESEYAQIVFSQMRASTIQEDIWRCRILPEHVDQLKISNQFWRDVLKSWSTFNFSHQFRIENQIIWYNSSIRIEDKIFMWRDVYRKGLMYIHQLFSNQKFKTYQEVEREFGLTKLRYNSLKIALPQQWKNFFTEHSKSTYFPIPPHNFDQCICKNISSTSRTVYKYLSEDITTIHYKFTKWTQELGEDICENIWSFNQLFLDIHKLTNVAKYRSFQYRLLQRGLVTNLQLHKWKIMSNNLCSFCHEQVESLSHLFWHCTIVKALWHKVNQYIQAQGYASNTQLSLKNIICNKIVPGKGHVANFICLLTKQFIYKQRCMGLSIDVPILKAHINRIENIEKYIAIKNGRVTRHNNKWKLTTTPTNRDNSLQLYVNEYIVNM